MNLLKEFKTFALKGNVLDLAIGVIIGAAFGKIVSSLVSDIIMPVIGLLLGGVDFSGLKATIGDATLTYGVFLQTVVDFLIVSFSIFLFIRMLNRFKQKEEEKPEEPPAPSKEELLLAEIRDLLKQQNQTGN
ncbi:large conductance mechanosensitive channel protein [Paenibacillus vortex V453]|jgi:large conductance mechanosensitive channel|uniref:Large-conductance mechanosensitive channel n=2 Tax=Paenibacillus TaxID=44249 RepID=A0A163LYR9_9BACL|nr:mechanosensitive ion channel protein MscL [Paenibacillus glucanolyticus]EFU40941.1 large conductance mechanosensitive channel protein [Paenibacillus vortex V453]ETT39869.1 large conductance mechanosensitive channel protein [Paenibacillus sp. FSL R5-808]MDH6675751.1 large conductance mechanosensitive channel [Paenibacillus sp. LBL]AVV58739.1 large conductance mechanosensitive channel protein MscL [Paenibacillus glucanolyticus]